MDSAHYLATAVAGLTGCVCFLFRENGKLGAKLDALSRALGQYEGLTKAVKSCPVTDCKLRTMAPDVTFETINHNS